MRRTSIPMAMLATALVATTAGPARAQHPDHSTQVFAPQGPHQPPGLYYPAPQTRQVHYAQQPQRQVYYAQQPQQQVYYTQQPQQPTYYTQQPQPLYYTQQQPQQVQQTWYTQQQPQQVQRTWYTQPQQSYPMQTQQWGWGTNAQGGAYRYQSTDNYPGLGGQRRYVVEGTNAEGATYRGLFNAPPGR